MAKLRFVSIGRLAQLVDWLNWLIMIWSILHPEITKNVVEICNKNCYTMLHPFFQKIFIKLKEKFFFFQTSFSSSIFFLFFGFLFGNLFGTFLTWIRTLIPWDGFIVISLLFFIEVISYIRYHNAGRSFLLLWKFPFSYKKRLVWKSLNFLKIGLMLGFFIDAFKVGS